MKVRIRYQDRDGNQATQEFEALKVEIAAPDIKLEVTPSGQTLHLDWKE